MTVFDTRAGGHDFKPAYLWGAMLALMPSLMYRCTICKACRYETIPRARFDRLKRDGMKGSGAVGVPDDDVAADVCPGPKGKRKPRKR